MARARASSSAGSPCPCPCPAHGVRLCHPPELPPRPASRPQTNFLGAYALTRLLTPALARSAPSRVVTVSSVMHRNGTLRDGSAAFLTDYEKGTYSHAKLAEARAAPPGPGRRPWGCPF